MLTKLKFQKHKKIKKYSGIYLFTAEYLTYSCQATYGDFSRGEYKIVAFRLPPDSRCACGDKFFFSFLLHLMYKFRPSVRLKDQ